MDKKQATISLDEKELLQGTFNAKVIPYQLNRFWPSWVYKQYSPSSPFFNATESPLSARNVTERNWTTLGLPGVDAKVIIDQHGLLTPLPHTWSIDIWIANSSKLISPSFLPNIKQTFDPSVPNHTTSFTIDQLDIESEYIFCPLPDDENIVVNKTVLKNTGKKTVKFSFFYAIRPYNPLGLSRTESITYLTSNVFMVNNQVGLVLDDKPDNIVCIPYDDGDISEHFNDWDMILKTTCNKGLASAFAEYKITLDPGQTKEIIGKIPTKQIQNKSNSDRQVLKIESRTNHIKELRFNSEKGHLKNHWSTWTSDLMSITTPNQTLNELIKQNQIHLLTSIGKKGMYPGVFNTKSVSYLTSSPLIHALQTMGATTQAKALIEHLLIQKKWYQLSTDCMIPPSDIGRLLFLITQNYRYNPDNPFLEKVLSQLSTMIDFIKQNRYSKRIHQKHLQGLIKQPLIADTFWAISATINAQFIAKKLKKTDLVEKFKKLEESLTNDLENFLNHTAEKQVFKPIIPITPTHYSDSRLVQALAGVYPLSILPANDERVTETLNHIENTCLTNGIIFSLKHPVGLSTSTNAQLANILTKRQDNKAHDLLEWFEKSASQTGTWPTSIHPQSGLGCDGEGQDFTTTAEILLLIRNMLIQEDKKTLHLTPNIPSSWLSNDTPITIKNAPTTFGPLSVTLTKQNEKIDIELETNWRKTPSEITISLPKTIDFMTIGQKKIPVDARQATLPKDTTKVTLHTTK